MYFKTFICVVILAVLTRCNGEYLNMAVGEDEKPVELFVEEIETESEFEVAEIIEELSESEIETELIEPETQCFNEERVNFKPKRIVRQECGWPNSGCNEPKYEYLENDYLSPDCGFARPRIVRKRPQCIVKRAAKPSTRVVYLKKRSSEPCERKAPVVAECCKTKKTESEVKSSKYSEPKVVEEEPVVQEKEEASEPIAETVEEEKPTETKSSKAEEPVQKKKISSKKSKPVKAKKPKKISKK